MFGVPHFPDVDINISDAEIHLISLMINHVIIEPKNQPRFYLYSSEVMALGISYSKNVELSLDQASKVFNDCLSHPIACSCSAHSKLMELADRDAFELYLLLSSL